MRNLNSNFHLLVAFTDYKEILFVLDKYMKCVVGCLVYILSGSQPVLVMACLDYGLSRLGLPLLNAALVVGVCVFS